MVALRPSTVALALVLCAAVIGPGRAHAQTDASLGCTYTVSPEKPGRVGHTNPLRLSISGCTYDWDALELLLGKGGRSTRTVAPPGYSCDDGGNDVLCVRPQRSTAGAVLSIRPQCPRGGRLPVTLAITDAAGVRRRGAVKNVSCTPPPVKVLAPPRRQSLAAVMRSGIVARFACRMRCTGKATVVAESGRGTGSTVGTMSFRRSRAGTYAGRVSVRPAFRRRWRRSSGVWVSVTLAMRASTGERVTLGHDVRLRR